MITKEQVMLLFLTACPSFVPNWETYSASNPDEGLLYIDIDELAHHMVALIKSNQTSEFPAVFDVIERLHIEGDDYVKEAATIGVLESLQNIASNNGVDPEAFVPWLGTESCKWWRQLNDFWQAKTPYVGAQSTRHNKSLDASGGSVFLNLLDPAEGALIRAAASTQTLGTYFHEAKKARPEFKKPDTFEGQRNGMPSVP